MRPCCPWVCRRYPRLRRILTWVMASVVFSFVLWYQYQDTDNLSSVLPLEVTNVANSTVRHDSTLFSRKNNIIWEATDPFIQKGGNTQKALAKPAVTERKTTAQLALFGKLCEQNNLTDGFPRSGSLLDVGSKLQSNLALRCPCIPDNLREWAFCKARAWCFRVIAIIMPYV